MIFFKKLLHTFFTKKVAISKWQLNLFGVICLSIGIIAGSYLTIFKILPVFATTTSSITKNTDTDFNQGTFSSTAVSGSGTAALVQLSGNGGPDNTLYKRAITITNSSSNALTNYPVSITLDTATLITGGKMQANCPDIRFRTSDDTTAISNYYVDTCNSTTTRIWVKVPTIAASPTTTTIYLYYGSSSATTQSSFTNTFISGLQLWLKADAVTGLSDGATVSTWDDLSGNSYNATQITTDKKPLYKTNIINGYPVIRFDGVNDGMVINTGLNVARPATLFIVNKPVGTPAGRTLQSATVGRNWLLGLWSNGVSHYAEGWVSDSSSTGALIGTTYIAVGVENTSTTNFYVNGVDYTVSSTPTGQPGNLAIGAAGNGCCPTEGGNSDVAEIIVYNSALSANDRNGIERYLAAKYSVTLGGSSPSTSVGSESVALPSPGTWESPTDSNVIDLLWNGGWGDGTSGSTAFSATVANVGANNTVAFAMRTASTTGGLSSATYQTLGTASSGTTFTKTKADLDALGLGTGSNRYVQVKATLAQTSGTNPQLDSFTIYYLSDNTAPETNASSPAMLLAAGGRTVTSGGWTNGASPYFSWTAGSDSQAGIKGYCLYLGTSSTGDPRTSKGLLGTSPVSTTGTTCQFIVSSTSVDLATSGYIGTALTSSSSLYYFSIAAVDIGGNVNTSYVSFSFKYDDTAPTNVSFISPASGSFGNVVDMNFSWPVSGSSAASDANSGVLGYQYQLNGTSGTWLGTQTDSTCGVSLIPAATASYTFTSAQDSANVVTGTNVIYFRAIDTACNISSSSSYRTGNISYGGAAPTFTATCDSTTGVTITPSTSTSNSFALSWSSATPSSGRTLNKYYYMINTSPPAALSTITGNTSTYIANGTTTSVAAGTLTGSVRGSNTVYVVATDDASNYSGSNCIKGTYTLNSTNPDPPLNLAATDASIKSASLWRASLGWTVPAYKGTGSLTYKIQRSTDNSTWTDVTTTTGTSYIDTVSTSSKYYWRVGSYDTSSASIASPSYATSVSLTPKGTYTTAPDLSSGPTVSSITTKKATVSWSTSRTSDSKISYGTTSGKYGSVDASNTDQVTSHSITLSNLSAGTTYYYKAKWTDEDGNTGTSEEKSFSTAPSPTVKDVSAKNIGLSSSIIQFTANGASSVKIYYGPTTSFGGSKTVSTSTSETTYTSELTGLTDGTKYYYKINTFDSDSTEYEGTVLDFTTLPRPRISNVRIQQVANTAQSTLLVSWTSNTEISSIVTYYPEGNVAAAKDEVNVALIKGEHKMIIRGLLPQTEYILVVKGRDKIGNEAGSDSQKLTTATDTRPPQIVDLHVEGSNVPPVSASGQDAKAQLVVSWNTDEPSTSQIEFGEGTGTSYAQKTQEDSNLTSNHLVIISGLTPSKVYHLRAISKDKAGNIGNSIDTVTITPKSTENALNLVITNLQDAFGFLGGLKQ